VHDNLAYTHTRSLFHDYLNEVEGMEGALTLLQKSGFDNNASNLSVFFYRRTSSHDSQPCWGIQ